MYIAPGQGQTTPWGQIFMSTESPYHFAHLLQVSKWSLQNLILYTFLMILYMYIAPGQGHTTLWGQTFDVNRKPLSLCPFVASLKKRILILYTFLMMLYMYKAPGQGQTIPWGQTFDVNTKPLSLCPFVAGLKWKRCKHYMIPRHCACFCCCMFWHKNINVTTRLDQIHQLFHKILSINILLTSIKGYNSVEKFGENDVY